MFYNPGIFSVIAFVCMQNEAVLDYILFAGVVGWHSALEPDLNSFSFFFTAAEKRPRGAAALDLQVSLSLRYRRALNE